MSIIPTESNLNHFICMQHFFPKPLSPPQPPNCLKARLSSSYLMYNLQQCVARGKQSLTLGKMFLKLPSVHLFQLPVEQCRNSSKPQITRCLLKRRLQHLEVRWDVFPPAEVRNNFTQLQQRSSLLFKRADFCPSPVIHSCMPDIN